MFDVKLKSALGIKTMLGIKGLGPATLNKLIVNFATVGDILNASEEDLKKVATAPVRRIFLENTSIVSQALEKAELDIFAAREVEVDVYSIYDDGYPKRLAVAPDAPYVIYAKGDLNTLNRSVGVVGTRNPDAFGSIVTERIAGKLAEAGWTIVSGLGRGVDAIAHNAAIQLNTPTVAVIGSGLDIYTSEAAIDVANRILDGGGAIISEHPLGVEYDPVSLLRRNRIVTGVSASVFFMQSHIEDPAMQAVRYALLQGKPVYAPDIPEKYRSHSLNHTAINLSQMPARDFGRLTSSREDVMDAIKALDRDNVAIAISGSDYYPVMLADLEGLLSNEEYKDMTHSISL